MTDDLVIHIVPLARVSACGMILLSREPQAESLEAAAMLARVLRFPVCGLCAARPALDPVEDGGWAFHDDVDAYATADEVTATRRRWARGFQGRMWL